MMRSLASCTLLVGLSPLAMGADEGTIRSPSAYQVIQREGYVPAHAHENEPGGPALGHARVPIVAEFPAAPNARIEWRVVPQDPSAGPGGEWKALEQVHIDESGGRVEGVADIPAGGWYRLEVRRAAEGRPTLTAKVEPVGVGEVLIVAGQSYAAGANDAVLRVEDPQGRVSVLDLERKAWRVAHDPQPAVGDGGTIWPPLGDLLAPVLRVPVGFINVAYGGTASRQWLPGTPLFQRLEEAGRVAGRFRAVLWQQGESDVIEKVSAETYESNIEAIRSALERAWGCSPTWLLAKSTLHPTVYREPEREGTIRAAIEHLWSRPGFGPGPDTDTLGGENRGGPTTRRHFSEIGQRRAALLWFVALCNEIQRRPDPVCPPAK